MKSVLKIIISVCLLIGCGFSHGKKIRISKSDKNILVKFKKSLEVMDNKDKFEEEDQAQAVSFLKSSFYRDVSFETLHLLAKMYNKRGDWDEEIKIREIAASNYPDNINSHFLLGKSYKNRWLKTENEEDKAQALEHLSKVIEKDKKNEAAYLEILSLVKKGRTHTSQSLSMLLKMITHIKKKSYFIDLCEAYYENNYIKQTLRSCKEAKKKNPDDFRSVLVSVMANSDLKKRDKESQIVDLADTQTKSLEIQIRSAYFFKEKDPNLAIKYFKQVLKIDPKNLEAHNNLAQLLFNNKNKSYRPQAYEHFLQSCLLTKGDTLKEFERAKNKLAYVNKKLKTTFEVGINKCYDLKKESFKTRI